MSTLEEALFIASDNNDLEEARRILFNHNDNFDIDWKNPAISDETALMTASLSGCKDIVKLLLTAGANPDKTNKYGSFAIIHAIVNRKIEVVKLLVAAGANINMKLRNTGNTPLAVACSIGETELVRLLIDSKANVNTLNKSGESPIFQASSIEIIKLLVAAGADLKIQRKLGYTFTFLSAYRKNMEILKLLLAADRNNLDLLTYTGDNIFFWACREGKVEIMKLLLAANVKLDLQDNRGLTAIMIASVNGDIEMVKLLLNAGANVNIQGRNGTVAISAACDNGNIEIIKLLLLAGASININNEKSAITHSIVSNNIDDQEILQLMTKAGSTIDIIYINKLIVTGKELFEATESNRIELTKEMLSNNCENVEIIDWRNSNKDKDTILIKASTEGYIEIVSNLLSLGANVNIKNKSGETALIKASYKGRKEIVQLLLAAGAKLDLQDMDGWTALMKASYQGQTEIVKLLLEYGANINVVSYTNATSAFILASYCGRTEIVKLLLKAGITIDHTENDGDTALINSSRQGQTEVIKLLISAGANIDFQNKLNNKSTALMKAARDGKIEVVKLLVKASCDVNLADEDGDTSLFYASSSGHSEIVKVLLSAGANVNFQNDTGSSPLHASSENGHIKVIQYLLDAGALVDLQDMNGSSALIIASSNDKADEIIELLIAAGSDVNLQTEIGRTAIMRAAKRGKLDIVKFCLAAGANPNLPDRDGSTALIEGSYHGDIELVKCLLEADALVNLQAKDGTTALFNACSKGHKEIVTLLLASGVDVNLKTKGLTAIDVANHKNWIEIENLLFDKSPTMMIHYIENNKNKNMNELYNFIANYNFSLETLISENFLLWLHIIQIDDAPMCLLIEQLVLKYPRLAYAKDSKGRSAADVASLHNKFALLSAFLWHGRYRITEKNPEHVSSTCYVYKALDERDLDDLGNPTKVCLKLMRYKQHFLREIETRKLEFDSGYIMKIINSFPSPELINDNLDDSYDAFVKSSASIEQNQTIDFLQKQTNITKPIAEQMYCIVMPMADRNLFVSLKQERWAGKLMDKVRSIFTNLLTCVSHMHSRGVIHGDIKPLNIVRVDNEMKLIDLDAACRIGKDHTGLKSSSAYIPPEALAIVINDKNNKQVVIKTSLVKFKYNIQPLIAQPSFDIWSLGCILYQMCHPDVLPLFSHVGQDDNLSGDLTREDNLFILADWNDTIKSSKLSRIEDKFAQNLLSQILTKDPLKRPSVERILGHPFLSGKNVARMLGDKAKFDVFVSYRVNSDKGHAKLVYKLLTAKGLSVFLDQMSLEPGKNWKDGFCEGLMSSRIFIPLLSKGAINNQNEPKQNFSKLNVDSPCDNVFLEQRFALELLQLGLIEKILPVFIGDFDGDKYGNFFNNGCAPKCPNVYVGSVENDLRLHMESQGLGIPIEKNRTVVSVFEDITNTHGFFIEGDKDEKFSELADTIVSSLLTGKSEFRDSTFDITSSPGRLKRDEIMEALRKENELLKNENEMINIQNQNLKEENVLKNKEIERLKLLIHS